MSISGTYFRDVEYTWAAIEGSSLTEKKAVNAEKYALTVHIPVTDNTNEATITKEITINRATGTIE